VHVFFFDPLPKKQKKTRGAGQFSKKNATRSALFPQPGIMDFRGEAPPPASRFSSGRLLINLWFFNKTSWISAAGG